MRARALLLPVFAFPVGCGGSPPPATSSAGTAEVRLAAQPSADRTGALSAPTAPPSAEADGCKERLKAGIALHDTKKYDEAIAIYRAGYDQCGSGKGFLGEIGYSLSAKGEYDAAADQLLAEILEPGAKPTAFGNLIEILPKLSAAQRALVASTGAKPDKPIHVLDVGGEYAWVQKLGCGGSGGTPESQSLVTAGGRSLDKLRFVCPDGSKHEAYFDFSADPMEKQMKKELGIPSE